MLIEVSSSTTVMIGPFVDDADGFTPKTGLSIVQANVRLSKAGADFAQKGDANAAVSSEAGFYQVALSTADTATVGELVLRASALSCLPVWHRYTVMPKNAYGAFVAGDDVLDSNVYSWAEVTVSTTLLEDADIQRMLKTTIASTSATNAVAFALTSGVSADDVYNNHALVVYGSGGHPYVAYVQDYVGADKRVTLNATPGLALAAGLTVRIFVNTAETAGSGITSAQASAIVANALSDYDVVTSTDLSANNAKIGSAIFAIPMAESYATASGETTMAQALYLIQHALTNFAITSTQYNVYQLDGTTIAISLTLDDEAEPTSLTKT